MIDLPTTAQVVGAVARHKQAVDRGHPVILTEADRPHVLMALGIAISTLEDRQHESAEDYFPIPFDVHGLALVRCPCCRQQPGMWERRGGRGGITKVVCCSLGKDFGGLLDGCVLYLPPEKFYSGSYRDAAKVWNDFAQACDTARADDFAAPALTVGPYEERRA